MGRYRSMERFFSIKIFWWEDYGEVLNEGMVNPAFLFNKCRAICREDAHVALKQLNNLKEKLAVDFDKIRCRLFICRINILYGINSYIDLFDRINLPVYKFFNDEECIPALINAKMMSNFDDDLQCAISVLRNVPAEVATNFIMEENMNILILTAAILNDDLYFAKEKCIKEPDDVFAHHVSCCREAMNLLGRNKNRQKTIMQCLYGPFYNGVINLRMVYMEIFDYGDR